MVVSEFSNQFDVLVNSYRRLREYDSQQASDTIEFNEYEKSIFLTKSQELIILSLYSGNYSGAGFEQSLENKRQLDVLIKQASVGNGIELLNEPKLIDHLYHLVYKLPEDCWFIVFELGLLGSEAGECSAGMSLDIYPATHDSYNRLINNPFRGPNKKRSIRLDVGKQNVELVSKFPLSDYIIRYIRRPKPIILSNLEYDGLTINGYSSPMTSELSSILHQDILEKAVQMALQSRAISTQDKNDKS